jgi:hypothetical protein
LQKIFTPAHDAEEIVPGKNRKYPNKIKISAFFGCQDCTELFLNAKFFDKA